MRRVTFNLSAILFGCALVLSGIGAKVWAQAEQPEITIRIDVAKEARQFKDNRWIVQRVPAVTTKRDDILVYTITYTNEGQSPAIDAVIVDPIPTGTIYILNSATGKNADISCSIDGARYFQPPPAKVTVRNPDGTTEEKIAPPEQYTHLRWTIRKPVLPGESGELGFKVMVR